MKFPVIEIVDRYAIAMVKFDMTDGANQEELDFYKSQITEIGIDLSDPKLLELIEHHRYVWTLEDDFKKARIDRLPLEEIGRRALYIRDIGYRRVDLKNDFAKILNDPVREIKQGHITES